MTGLFEHERLNKDLALHHASRESVSLEGAYPEVNPKTRTKTTTVRGNPVCSVPT